MLCRCRALIRLVGCGLLAVRGATAQTPRLPALPEFDDGKLTAGSFIAENDVVPQLGRNHDRNYTGGFAFQGSGSFVRRAHLDAPLRALDRLTGMHRAHAFSPRRFYTLTLVGTGFTPDSLNTPNVLPNDRPYGSILALSVRKLTVNDATRDEAVSSELVIGVLGLRLARDLQTWLHSRLRASSGEPRPYEPLGWGNQISDGGELTALYRVSYERRLLGDPSGPGRKNFQVSGGGQAAVGYYTNATLLSMARWGWFDSDFWEFSPGATNTVNQAAGSGSRRPPAGELFLFGGLRPRIVGYNALLQGQFRSSAHTLSAGEIERLQLEWDFGVAAFIRPIRIQLVWNFLAGRSAEHKKAEARAHSWGSLMALYAWPVRLPAGIPGASP